MKSFVEQYRRWGVCFIPVPYKSKAANIKWEEFQKRFPTDTEIASWLSSNNTNVAIVCGGISGNLVALDCDEDIRCEAEQLQRILDGYAGTNTDIEEYVRVLRHFAD